jgi:hypothetical protein
MVKRLIASNFKQSNLTEVHSMRQNNHKNHKTIEIVALLQGQTVPGGVIMGESFLSIPCYYMQVFPLEKPIPIPKSRKKRRQ